MKELYRGFFACDPPTSTAQQKCCSGGRYYPTPKVEAAKRLWGVMANLIHQKTGNKISEIGKPLAFHITFCSPLLKKHKGVEITWNVLKPDCDNWVKLVQDAMVKHSVIADDSKVARLTVEKTHSETPGVFIWIGALDDDDLPSVEDLMCNPELIP